MAALHVHRVRLPLRTPLVTAWGTLAERELLRVSILFSDADRGDGEAAPLEPYDGVATAAVVAALDAYGSVLAHADPLAPVEELVAACRDERDLPQALAAVDMALWDREARRAQLPVAGVLGPHHAHRVAVNATIGAEDRAGAAKAAAEAVASGFRCVKVKVGIGDDAGRIAAVRAAVGPGVAIRVDANGAWRTPEEALANLRALAPTGLELCEEPIHGIQELAAVRAESPVPIAMDETAADPDGPGSGAADAVCLKVSRCGGISALLHDAEAARRAGSAVYLSSTFDGPQGIAAAVHAAAALEASGPLLPSGLATLDAFAEPPHGMLEVRDGALTLPAGPGLLGPA